MLDWTRHLIEPQLTKGASLAACSCWRTKKRSMMQAIGHGRGFARAALATTGVEAAEGGCLLINRSNGTAQAPLIHKPHLKLSRLLATESNSCLAST